MNPKPKVNIEENKKKIYDFFSSKGLSHNQIIGIMANLQQESGFNPDITNQASVNDKDGGPFGLAQWRGSRKKSLLKQKDYNTLEGQLNFYWKELNTTHKKAFTNLKKAKTSEDATKVIFNDFEKPDNPKTKNIEGNLTGRLNFGNTLNKEFKKETKPLTREKFENSLVNFDNLDKSNPKSALTAIKRSKVQAKEVLDLTLKQYNELQKNIDDNPIRENQDALNNFIKEQNKLRPGIIDLTLTEKNKEIQLGNDTLDKKINGLKAIDKKLEDYKTEALRYEAKNPETVFSKITSFIAANNDVSGHDRKRRAFIENKLGYKLIDLKKEKFKLTKDAKQELLNFEYSKANEVLDNYPVDSKEFQDAKTKINSIKNDRTQIKLIKFGKGAIGSLSLLGGVSKDPLEQLANSDSLISYYEQKKNKIYDLPKSSNKTKTIDPAVTPDKASDVKSADTQSQKDLFRTFGYDETGKKISKYNENANKFFEDITPPTEKSKTDKKDNKKFGIKDIPLDAIASGLLGLSALSDADVTIPKRDEKISQALFNFIAEQKRISEMGLRPEDELAAKQNIAQAYQTGIDNITRASGGNRNLLLGNLKNLNSARISSLTQLAIADAEQKTKGLENYGKSLKYINDFETNKSVAQHQQDLEEARLKRQAAGNLAAGAFSNMVQSIQDKKENGPGSINDMVRTMYMKDILGNPDDPNKVEIVNGLKKVHAIKTDIKTQTNSILSNNFQNRFNKQFDGKSLFNNNPENGVKSPLATLSSNNVSSENQITPLNTNLFNVANRNDEIKTNPLFDPINLPLL